MCSGHPRYHPCRHTSLVWSRCPKAICSTFDQSSSSTKEYGTYNNHCNDWDLKEVKFVDWSCPLRHCRYQDKGGHWYCCECGSGPNTAGWCRATKFEKMKKSKGDRDSKSYGENIEEGEYMEVVGGCGHGCCENCIGVTLTELSRACLLAKQDDCK